MSEITSGTNGSDTGANGACRKLALGMAAVFLLVLALITIGNAESMISDFAAAGVHETLAHIWIWQISSVLAWLCVTVLVWWGVARIRPPRFTWPMVAILFVIGLPVASGCHIGLMIAFRSLVYAAEGERYHFMGDIANPYLYEFRKDVPTYLQFVTLAGLCQWLLARVGTQTPQPELEKGRYLAVGDGAVTHQVPIDDIVQVTAAGNYVEIELDGRALLHRATLATMESELGGRFVRIHRSRLINRDAIRRIETNQSGDFEVVLSDGSTAKGSRRYRADLEQRL
ncbi:MAG TPA: LytTR family DNA-binding domain-containing protein [Sphingomonas sp.]|uniref:LytTR family DNA-binding domain-containing protein n=1 Tax=Sphingomonas sp. TaxID=28214 RepID=UPI002CC80189|nr:LytTR family DNA-binding domain-containing protein [Sphingomonas sp.]HMI18681.1 LytTR family DNA-binding domain-containing protein [Sphingomonas sp.]